MTTNRPRSGGQEVLTLLGLVTSSPALPGYQAYYRPLLYYPGIFSPHSHYSKIVRTEGGAEPLHTTAPPVYYYSKIKYLTAPQQEMVETEDGSLSPSSSKTLTPSARNTTRIVEEDVNVKVSVELDCPCAEKKMVENVVDLRELVLDLNVMQKDCQCSADDNKVDDYNNKVNNDDNKVDDNVGEVEIAATDLTSSILKPSESSSNSTIFVFDETSDLESSDIKVTVSLECPCGETQTFEGIVDLRVVILEADGMSKNCKKCDGIYGNDVDDDDGKNTEEEFGNLFDLRTVE